MRVAIGEREFDIPNTLRDWKYCMYLPYSMLSMEYKRLRTAGDYTALEVGVKAVHEAIGADDVLTEDVSISSKTSIVNGLITLLDAVEVNYTPPVIKQSGYKFTYKGEEYSVPFVNYCGIENPDLTYGRYVEYLERRRKLIEEDKDGVKRFTFDCETVSIFAHKVGQDTSLLKLAKNVDEGAYHFQEIDTHTMKDIAFFLTGLIYGLENMEDMPFTSIPQNESIPTQALT